MRISSLIIVVAFFFSCSDSNNPTDILPADKMRLVVFDMLRADEYLNNFILKDTLLNREKEAIKLYEQVFLIHKTNAADFYKSYRYYQARPDINKVLIDSLDALAVRKRQRSDSSIKPN